jgi:hypothetical protein
VYTRPFSLPLPPKTTFLKLSVTSILLKKQSATYASQLDVYLDTLSLSVHNIGVPLKKTYPKDGLTIDPEDSKLMTLVSIKQTSAAPSVPGAPLDMPSRLLRIVKHPVGCHWMCSHEDAIPTGIGKVSQSPSPNPSPRPV